MAEVVHLDAYRNKAPATTGKPLRYATLKATTSGNVVMSIDGNEIEVSPANARTWAERLLAMADVAEGVRREEQAKTGPWRRCWAANATSCTRGRNHG